MTAAGTYLYFSCALGHSHLGSLDNDMGDGYLHYYPQKDHRFCSFFLVQTGSRAAYDFLHSVFHRQARYWHQARLSSSALYSLRRQARTSVRDPVAIGLRSPCS